ncbi:MAG: hypothetical protein ACNA7V_03075 [Bacteroidales bacterium]
MKKTILLSLIILPAFLTGIIASEPVTNTKFYTVYGSLPEVSHIETHGTADGNVLPFLIGPENPIDQKAAVMNTLLVNNQNKNNAVTFRMFVARTYRENFETLDLNKLTADELFCLGYLTLLDEDGATANALPILQMAKVKNPSSSTIAIVHALATTQASAKAGNPCEGWNLFMQVVGNSSLNNDMHPEMVSIVSRSMQPYGEGCQ